MMKVKKKKLSELGANKFQLFSLKEGTPLLPLILHNLHLYTQVQVNRRTLLL